MAEPTAETVVPRCPWCSAALPPGVGENCPSCGATLASPGDASVPGVTAIDPEAVLRGVRAATAPRRNRILSFITGEVPEDYQEIGKPEALAPPPADVRREMLRMEVEAEIADLTAEAEAIAADEAVETGRPVTSADLESTNGEPAGSAEASAAPGTEAPVAPVEVTAPEPTVTQDSQPGA
jgi:hypothetical protein